MQLIHPRLYPFITRLLYDPHPFIGGIVISVRQIVDSCGFLHKDIHIGVHVRLKCIRMDIHIVIQPAVAARSVATVVRDDKKRCFYDTDNRKLACCENVIIIVHIIKPKLDAVPDI
jgi:hypothetical protein